MDQKRVAVPSIEPSNRIKWIHILLMRYEKPDFRYHSTNVPTLKLLVLYENM